MDKEAFFKDEKKRPVLRRERKVWERGIIKK